MAAPFFWKAMNGWYVNTRLPNGKRGRKKLGDTKAKAMEAWRKMQEPSSNPYVLDIADKQVDYMLDRLKAGAISQSHIDSYKRAISDAIPSKMRWGAMTAEFVMDYCSSKQWKQNTVRTRMTHLKSLSRFGRDHYGLQDSLGKLKKPVSARRLKHVTRDEYETILNHIFRNNRTSDHRVALVLAVLWHTGARPGELFRLKRSEVEEDRLVLYKHKTEKTGKPRIIYLNRAAKIAINMAEKLGAHVFHDARCNPWNKDTFSARMKRMVKACNLDTAIVAYSFRHAYATRALSRGVSITILAELMGTSVAMIEKHYGHLSDRQDILRQEARRV